MNGGFFSLVWTNEVERTEALTIIAFDNGFALNLVWCESEHIRHTLAHTHTHTHAQIDAPDPKHPPNWRVNQKLLSFASDDWKELQVDPLQMKTFFCVGPFLVVCVLALSGWHVNSIQIWKHEIFVRWISLSRQSVKTHQQFFLLPLSFRFFCFKHIHTHSHAHAAESEIHSHFDFQQQLLFRFPCQTHFSMLLKRFV